MKNVTTYLLFAGLMLLINPTLFAQNDGVFGKWATIDDETGEKKSVVEIYERNGKVYGELHEGFKWSTNAQAILCCIITNWIRKRKYNIPLDYMKLHFRYGDLKQKRRTTGFSYLKYLNPLLKFTLFIPGCNVNFFLSNPSKLIT